MLSRWTAESEEVPAAAAELCAYLVSQVQDKIVLHAYVYMYAASKLKKRRASVRGHDAVVKTMTAQQTRALTVIEKEYEQLNTLHKWAGTFQPQSPLNYKLPAVSASQLAHSSVEGSFPWIEDPKAADSYTAGLPKVLQNKVAVLNCRRARAAEEVKLIQYEMRCSLRHYTRCIRVLQDKVSDLNKELGQISASYADHALDVVRRQRYLRGMIALLEERAAADKGLKAEAVPAFQPYTDVPAGTN